LSRDTTDDGVVDHLGHRLDVVQHAVDAEADQRGVALGLDVDVARPRVEGVLEHELDGVDDVLVARLDLGLALHADELLEVAEVDAGVEVALGPLDGMAKAVELGDGAQDLRLGGDDELDVAPGDAAEGVDPLDVERVGAGDAQLAAGHAEGDHPVPLGEGARDARLDEVGVELQGVDAHVLELRLAGEGPGDVVLADGHPRLARAGEAVGGDQVVGDRLLLVGHRRAHPVPHLARLPLDLLGLLGGDHPLANQHIRDEPRCERHRPGV